MRELEIMSPAGNWACLSAAIDAGCDAVYFGIEGLNMRSGAENFSAEDLPEIVERCRQGGVKAYLALNTLIYENELEEVSTLLKKSADSGVDAVICSDFAVFDEARSVGLPVFISTQLSVANSSSILHFYRNFGVTRFVLARECTLDDISGIRQDLASALGDDAGKIELEVFIHGAMCVSVSGRCYISQFQYWKSANRGECLQPCRREYKIINEEEDQEFVLGSKYVMSPKDLCAMPFIEKLIEAGVDSFKIEGRNRSPEYVSIVTSSYRKAVEFYAGHKDEDGFKERFDELKKELVEKMESVYHRGFSDGFFMGAPVDEWTDGGGSQASRVKFYIGIVTNYFAKPGVAEVLVHDQPLVEGEDVVFIGKTTGVLAQKAESMQVEHEAVRSAEKGTLVALKTDGAVRRGDKLYVVRERDA